MIILEKFIANR